MANEKNLQDMIKTSLQSIRTLVDANTVVGTPVETAAGVTIIPISKVSVGYVSGGLEKETPANFAGGGGTGVTVQPVCFLCVHDDGHTEVLPVGTLPAPDAIDKIANIMERTPDIIGKIKALFKKKHATEEELAREEEAIDEAVDTVAEAAAEAADEAAQRADV